MFHLLAYEETLAAPSTNQDLDAAVDPTFSQRNGHYVFTEPWRVLALLAIGTSMVRIRANIPTWNALARHIVDPPNRSATIPSNPQAQTFLDFPLMLPENEEIAWEATNDLACGTEQGTLFKWVAPPTWNANLPRGRQIIAVRWTGAVAGVANAWSGLGAITFAENLRGGVYSVIGAEVFDAGTLAFRFQFPKMPLISGRQLRPGTLCREAIGNVPFMSPNPGPYAFGLWGRFHTFEPPQVEIYANATAASVQEGRMYLVYEGETTTI